MILFHSRDHVSGQEVEAEVDTGPWRHLGRDDARRVPVPFTAAFDKRVPCFQVRERLLRWESGGIVALSLEEQQALEALCSLPQVLVKSWMRTALICVRSSGPSPLEGMISKSGRRIPEGSAAEGGTGEGGRAAGGGSSPAVEVVGGRKAVVGAWRVLAAFRNQPLVPEYIAVLVHSIKYHSQVSVKAQDQEDVLPYSPSIVRNVSTLV